MPLPVGLTSSETSLPRFPHRVVFCVRSVGIVLPAVGIPLFVVDHFFRCREKPFKLFSHLILLRSCSRSHLSNLCFTSLTDRPNQVRRPSSDSLSSRYHCGDICLIVIVVGAPFEAPPPHQFKNSSSSVSKTSSTFTPPPLRRSPSRHFWIASRPGLTPLLLPLL